VRPLRLASAGIGLVGVSFGMARYGYGLLLPEMRRAFGLGPAALGLIGGAAYGSYLAATAAAGALAARVGARRTAVTGGLLAAAGMATAGLAATPAALAAGIVVGGASAALCYPPFSDAASTLADRARDRVLAAVSCGTGYGVAVAAPVAIVAGSAWRHAWLAFAVIALAATAWAARVLPARALARPPRGRWRRLRRPGVVPLLAAAVLLGAGSAPYWTFAVTHLADAGASPSQSRAFLAAAGVASVLATVTGDLVRQLGGLRAYALVTALEAAGIALLAVFAASVPVAVGSALLFGAAYNAAVGVQAIASTRLVPEQPSLGLAAAMGANGAGLLLGPVAAGAGADAMGLGPVLVTGSVLVLASAAPYAGAARAGARRQPARGARASRRPAARPSARPARPPAAHRGCAP
jgi:predicted MFS family arabinose efflux permease